MPATRRMRWVLWGMLCLLIVSSILSLWCIIGLTSPARLQARVMAPSSQIVDRNGRILYRVMDPHSGLHNPLPLDEMPLALRQAIIATEDANFYRNPGVAPVGIVRAAWLNLRAGEIVSGGSTLTQQLARNLFIPAEVRWEQSWQRKAREALLALSLTLNYSKDEILALYLNDTYFGHMAYGVEAAARSYFAKPVSQLDLAECALLAGLPQAPSYYDPLTNPEEAKARQRTVLDLMVKAGQLDPTQADRAFREPLRYAASPLQIEAPHATMLALQQAEALLGLEALARGGWTIQTTIDLDQQHLAERAVARQLDMLNAPQPDAPAHQVDNAAVLVLDVQSGALRAMVGSPDYFDASISGAVNAAMAPRQPGSAIKPLTYAAALERGLTLSHILADTECTFSTAEGRPYQPINYDYAYHGPVTLRRSLACSYNVATVRLYEEIGLETLPEIAQRLGVTSLSRADDHGLALTLGSGEVSMLELTAAYAAFAKGGERVDPYLIECINDADGETLYQASPQVAERVLEPRIAYLISDVLTDADARQPAFSANGPLELPFPAAVKTGTTTDWRDNWTIGYTPDTVVAVWAGNADGRPMVEVSGVSGAAPIWNAVMRGLPQSGASFARPEGLVERWICPISGELAGAACPHRQLELFLAENAPTHTCQQHRIIHVDLRSGEIAAPDLDDDLCVLRTITLWTPETQDWAASRGLTAEEPAATTLPFELEPGSAQSKVDLLHPPDGSRYLIAKELDRALQRVEVRAQVDPSLVDGIIHLEIDGETVHTWRSPPYRWLWPIEPGQHQLRLVVYDANSAPALSSAPVTVSVIDEH